MKWDWTINIGLIIHLFGMILSGVALYYKLVARITRVEDAHLAEKADIGEIKTDLHELKRGWVGDLEKRVRELEIRQATLLARPG